MASARRALVSFAGTSVFLACVSADDYHPLIVGGNPVEHLERFPFVTALIRKGLDGDDKSWMGQFCGGTLIGTEGTESRWVVTAAHCLVDAHKDDLVVESHRLNLKKPAEIERAQVADIKKIIIHPDYDPTTMRHDIGLLKLKTPMTVHATVSLDDGRHSHDDAELIVAGWGNKRGSWSEKPASWPGRMNYVDVLSIPHEDCKKWVAGVHAATMICAGFKEKGKDSCQGDSGGPLFAEPVPGAFVLSGVVSWGEGCAERKHPGVYTRVSLYKQWVESKTGLDTTYAGRRLMSGADVFV